MSGPSSFGRIEQLFHQACELDEGAREAFLDRACGEDRELRAEVDRLLAADPVATAGVLARLRDAVGQAGLSAGERVGPYRVVELLGLGGMGEVYRAEQSAPLRRMVALKVIKAGMDTRQLLRRFELERQALAAMSHPGVARVYDAGVTERGRPYFAMELVEGEPITEHCDRRRLDLSERLALFTRVCEAVQHAHQRGVIHRDLKPSNILVEQQDGGPRPKIIDFGIAKAAAPHAVARTVATRAEQVLGTPEYMSPEQAELASVVDIRTDVYSLGVVLYELIAGSHPFDVERLRRSGADAVRAYLRETDPELPSSRVTRDDRAAERIAALRGSDPLSLRRALRGDLDAIVGRALEKEPDRRYASVAELSADVERHLRHEPVLAGPPSRLYRARKFVRRHRWPVAAVGAVALSLVAAVVGVSLALLQARRAEADALRQAAIAQQVTGVLTGLFEADDPYRAEPGERTLRGVVRDAARRLAEIEDPEVLARVTLALGDVLLRQGLRDEVGGLLADAAARLERAGRRGPLHLDLLAQQAHTLVLQGRYEEARAIADRVVALAPALVGPESNRMGSYLKSRGDAELSIGGASEEAVAWYRKAVDALRAAPDADAHQLASVYRAIAGQVTDPDECTRAGDQALAIWRSLVGQEHPRVAETLHTLSWCAVKAGDLVEAERLARTAMEIREARLGAGHPITLEAVVLRADLLYSLGRFDEARVLVDRFLPEARAAGWMVGVGSLLNAAFASLPGNADFAESRRRLDEAVEVFLGLYGRETEYSLMARHTRADGFADQGRLEQARERYLGVLARRAEMGLPDNYFQALLLENLGNVERRLGLLDQAEERLSRALEIYPGAGWDPRYRARAWVSLAMVLHQLGRLDEAEGAWRRAREVYAGCRGPATFPDLRYEARWRALRGEREAVRRLVEQLFAMGVHPDFLAREAELVAVLGEAGLRALAGRPGADAEADAEGAS